MAREAEKFKEQLDILERGQMSRLKELEKMQLEMQAQLRALTELCQRGFQNLHDEVESSKHVTLGVQLSHSRPMWFVFVPCIIRVVGSLIFYFYFLIFYYKYNMIYLVRSKYYNEINFIINYEYNNKNAIISENNKQALRVGFIFI